MNAKDLMPPTLNGNTIMLNFLNRQEPLGFALQAVLEQFAVRRLDNGTYLLSTPLTADLEYNYLGMVHGAKARAADKGKPDPTPPTGGNNPDGTPPGGGTPGTPVLEAYTFTEARAA